MKSGRDITQRTRRTGVRNTAQRGDSRAGQLGDVASALAGWSNGMNGSEVGERHNDHRQEQPQGLYDDHDVDDYVRVVFPTERRMSCNCAEFARRDLKSCGCNAGMTTPVKVRQALRGDRVQTLKHWAV